jgi:uncharacterized protein (DUF433 family)
LPSRASRFESGEGQGSSRSSFGRLGGACSKRAFCVACFGAEDVPLEQWRDEDCRCLIASGTLIRMARVTDIYGGRDPIQLPAYTATEAASFIGVPYNTIRAWVFGQRYQAQKGPREFEPVIEVADPEGRLLSFQNLVELHVLGAVTREHEVRLQAVRKAVEYLRSMFNSKHPLADQEMHTDGTNLFVEKYGQLINVSAEGQLGLRDALRVHLQRVKRDPKGLPQRLYPFMGKEPDDRTFVAIDPRIEFGRPCLTGTGIQTAIVAERFKAGESLESLATDYGRKSGEIEDAIRYQIELKAA